MTAPHGGHNAEPVVVETTSAIRPNGGSRCALVLGLFLALHTPAWLILVFFREDVTATSENDHGTAKVFLRILSRWLLDFTPWFANAMLSLFLGILFLFLGAATLDGPAETL